MCYLLPIQSLIPQMFIKSLLCARPVRILGMGHSNIQDRSFSRGANTVYSNLGSAVGPAALGMSFFQAEWHQRI